MVRQIFDTVWVGLAIIAAFSSIIGAIVLAANHLPFVLAAILFSTPFAIGWDVAKDMRAKRAR